MKTTKLGQHTFKALQAVAVELRKAPSSPMQTRRINAAHRQVGAMPPLAKKEGVE